MFWIFGTASFLYQYLTKTFAHHRHLTKIHLPKYFILGKTLYLIIKTMSQFANYHYLCQVIRRSYAKNH